MSYKLFSLVVSNFLFLTLNSQEPGRAAVKVQVKSADNIPLARATVQLHKLPDSTLEKAALTDETGKVSFTKIANGRYYLITSMVNHTAQSTPAFEINHEDVTLPVIVLQSHASTLEGVTVSGRKPLIELRPDKTIVNVEAGISNAGATVLEVLEKSPGITVDKDGNISLKGRQNVLILLDGKPTYLPSSEIGQLLSGMSASQIDQLEIMDNPPAKYDAAGNAGVINIRTKKLRQRGFNGNISSSYGQGHYYKNNNSVSLNYRHDKVNLFATYSSGFNKGFTDLYALRTYYQPNSTRPVSVLNQDTWLTSALQNHTVRAGADYYAGKATTFGFAVSGISINRNGSGEASGLWRSPVGVTDSLIVTGSNSRNEFGNIGGNLNFRHNFSAGHELSADIDYLKYSIVGKQFFDNTVKYPSSYTEMVTGDLPSDISIFSAKIDYRRRFFEKLNVDAGYKSSFVNTDNLAEYYLLEPGGWTTDYDKTNHFLYTEKIHALYASGAGEFGNLSLQGGLRFEQTTYDADQKGNAQRKDSAFSRKYNALFPTLFAQYKMDSNQSISFSGGRRIDRPAYQKLNPFVFVINKYTYQQGNPFFLPQYTWNFELGHQFRQVLMTSFNYSITNDYFSQIFLSYPDGILIYTEGNLGRMRNVGVTVSSQLEPVRWWSLSLQANLYNKKIEGIVWNERKTALTQFNMNLSNQFRFGRGWTGELSGFFVTKEQELQEITDPTGQVAAGIAKQVLKNKGSVKLTLRDIFYTQAMKGDTDFEQAFEYFKLTRDTRVLTVAFSYRFGKAFKTAPKRIGASEEVNRVGTGG